VSNKNNDDIKPGDLVLVLNQDGIFGTYPKCWEPNNWDRPITAADNIHIPQNSVGIVTNQVVPFFHTVLFTVIWLDLGRLELTVPSTRIIKLI